MSRVSAEQRKLGFLRLPFAAKRRRVRPLLRAFRRASRLAAMLLLLSLTAAWVLASPGFGLRVVSVNGAERVPTEWIEAAVAEWHGENLVRLDLSAVQSRLLDHDWIRGVELRKMLPDRLEVDVHEHQPRALLITADRRRLFLDAAGSVIAEMESSAESSAPGDWLEVRIADPVWRSFSEHQAGSETELLRQRFFLQERLGLRQALELVWQLGDKDWAQMGRVSSLLLLGRGDLQITLDGLDFPVRLELGTAGEKMALLGRLLPELRSRFGTLGLVDLRFSRRIVVRPVGDSSSPASGLG